MTRIKQLMLDALRCPVRRALQASWEASRLRAWESAGPGHQVFVPDAAVDAMREALGGLVRSKVLDWWEVETHEGWLRHDWQLEVKFTYTLEGKRLTGAERFRVW